MPELKRDAPTGWRRLALGDLLASVEAGVSATGGERPAQANEHGILTLTAVVTGHFDARANKVVQNGQPDRLGRPLRKDTVLISRSNTLDLVGRTAFVDRDYPLLHLPDLLWAMRVRDARELLPHWLHFCLSAPEQRQGLKAIASGTSANMKKLSIGRLKRLLIDFPPHDEQAQQVQILKTWDHAESTTLRLMQRQRKLKRGLLRQLLTGERRFPEFRKQPWIEVSIGDQLKEVERHVSWSDDEEYRLVSVRRRSGGFFDRERKQGRDILTKTLKVTRTGDFVLARMQVLHGAMTVTPPEFDGAHVSDSYMTFVPKDDKRLHMPYFGYLSSTRLMYHKALISSVGVAIEKMSFNPRWWLAERVQIPPSLEEQKKIADVLRACDRELELLRSLHDALKEQKKELMQKLLTGAVRVPASMLKEVSHA